MSGYVVRAAECQCKHSEVLHNFNTKGDKRTRCDVTDQGGRCACSSFVLAGFRVWTSTTSWEPAPDTTPPALP